MNCCTDIIVQNCVLTYNIETCDDINVRIIKILPIHVKPSMSRSKPGGHEHVYPPSVFVHVAMPPLQASVPSSHSSMSEMIIMVNEESKIITLLV